MIVTLLGRGKTGTGVTGQVGEKGMTVRGATNRIDGVSETALLMTFDVGEDATELEGAGGAGDSGKPALLAQGDTLFLSTFTRRLDSRAIATKPSSGCSRTKRRSTAHTCRRDQ